MPGTSGSTSPNPQTITIHPTPMVSSSIFAGKTSGLNPRPVADAGRVTGRKKGSRFAEVAIYRDPRPRPFQLTERRERCSCRRGLCSRLRSTSRLMRYARRLRMVSWCFCEWVGISAHEWVSWRMDGISIEGSETQLGSVRGEVVGFQPGPSPPGPSIGLVKSIGDSVLISPAV